VLEAAGADSLEHSQSQLSGNGQGGWPAGVIFLWWFPFFCAAEKPEKSSNCSKIVQKIADWTLG
jgi:hypothetical protein